MKRSRWPSLISHKPDGFCGRKAALNGREGEGRSVSFKKTHKKTCATEVSNLCDLRKDLVVFGTRCCSRCTTYY